MREMKFVNDNAIKSFLIKIGSKLAKLLLEFAAGRYGRRGG